MNKKSPSSEEKLGVINKFYYKYQLFFIIKMLRFTTTHSKFRRKQK